MTDKQQEQRRKSAICRMAGNIASGIIVGRDLPQSDWSAGLVADLSVKLAVLIYDRVDCLDQVEQG